MRSPYLPEVVLLVIGLSLLAVAIWALVQPRAFQRFVGWWSGVAAQINTLTGCVCAAAALALWILVLLHQPLTNWVLTGLGAVCAWWAFLYFRSPAYQKALEALVTNRTTAALRAYVALLALLALAFVLIAIRGMS